MIELIPMTSYFLVLISSTNLFLRGKVQQRARGLQVHLDEHEPPGSIERAKREGMLDPRHLVVVQLHRVDHAAAVLIVLSVGAEDAEQQHSRLRAERVHRVVDGMLPHEPCPRS